MEETRQFIGLYGMVSLNFPRSPNIVYNYRMKLNAPNGLGHESVIKLLIRNGSDVNARNNSKNPPLYWAAWRGLENVAKLLIQSGSKIDVKNVDGWTPLGQAIRYGKFGAQRRLICLRRIHVIDQYTKKGFITGQEKVVELLLNNGADIRTKTNDGLEARDIAISKGMCILNA